MNITVDEALTIPKHHESQFDAEVIATSGAGPRSGPDPLVRMNWRKCGITSGTLCVQEETATTSVLYLNSLETRSDKPMFRLFQIFECF